MSPSKKYALHPGEISSVNDGQIHYISYAQLARLYQLEPHEYIVWIWNDERSFAGRSWDDYIHLYPNYYGEYGRPDENS